MSAILIIQKENELYFGTDSAISTIIDDQIVRIGEDGKKIWMVEDKIIFCAGNMNIAHTLIDKYIDSSIRSVELLKALAIELFDDKFMLEIIIGVIKNNKTIVYQISSYNSFEIIKRTVKNKEIGLWSGGIRTKESFNIAYSELKKGKSAKDIYQNTFNYISFEGIGGTLNVYRLDKDMIDLIYSNNIVEKEIKKLCYGEKYLVNAETFWGKTVIANDALFDGIDIYDGEQNPVVEIGKYMDGETEKRGIRINGGSLEIVNGLPESQINQITTEKWNNTNTDFTNFITNTLPPLQAQVDGNITSYFYDIPPIFANVTTTTLITDTVIQLDNVLGLTDGYEIDFINKSNEAVLATKTIATGGIDTVNKTVTLTTTIGVVLTANQVILYDSPSNEIDWISETYRNNHLGDLYYDNVSGYSYRWTKNTISNLFSWSILSNSDVAKALADAARAQDTADGKRTVFITPFIKDTIEYNNPIPPYFVGDLWITSSVSGEGDFKKCVTERISGSYYSDDWKLASKYTDDSSLTTFIGGVFADTLVTLDDKIQTYYQSSMPHTEYTNIPDNVDYNKIVGDLWYDSDSTEKKTYRYTKTANGSNFDYKWNYLEIPKSIFDTIDGKRRVFLTTVAHPTPTPPYQEGDLWQDGLIFKICTYADGRPLGESYVDTDWVYTTVSQQISDLANDSKLTPSEKLLIKKEWEVIKLEKPKLDAQSSLYTLPIDTSVNIQFTQWLNGTIKKVEPFWDYNLDGIYNTSDNFSWASATALIIYDKAYDWLNRYITNYLLLDNGLTTNLPSDFAPIITPPGQTASELNTQGEVFRKSFADYYWAKANLIGAITNNINSTLADIASDSKLSPSEKQVIKKEWDIIASEKLIFDTQSTTYGISVSTEKTNYNDAYVALDNYLNSPIGSALLTSLTTTSTIVGTDFRLIFKDYYDKKTLLSNKLSDVIKTTADNSIQSGTNYNKCFIDLNGIQVQNATETEVVKMGEFATGLYGLRASHSDGSYTQLTANGLERFISIEGVDTSKPYQYETYVQTASTIGSGVDFVDHDWSDATKAAAHAVWTNGILVDLPTRFRNKDFQCFLSITKMKLILGVPTAYSDMNLEIISIDKSLARLQISGYNLVYESFEGYYYQGIEFLITTIL